MISKVCDSAADAVADVFDGAMIAVGGFSTLHNYPRGLMKALADRPTVKGLTVISNNFPYQPWAENHQVSKLIAAFGASVYRRANSHEEQIKSGEISFEPTPQGIMVERLRAGAAGIPAFFSPVGVGTLVAEGKEKRVIDGREYVLETALRPDFAFVRAQKGDVLGNLSGIGSTLNFHPPMAAAGRVTIAEVDELVEAGGIPADDVRIPGIYVHRIVKHDPAIDADIANLEAGRRRQRAPKPDDYVGLTPELMALRTALMLKPGHYVNLGMGLPTMVSDYISPESGVILHGENGILGYGPEPSESNRLWYHFNAVGTPVTALPGASFFSSVDAFTMARGGHLDTVILGGLQVSETGDLANWWAPFMAAGGMGGAMDLCAGTKDVIIMMEHLTRDGEKKILHKCTYPLTSVGSVTKIVTELCYIEVTPQGLVLKELAPGVTPAYVQERTEPKLIVAPDCKEMQFA